MDDLTVGDRVLWRQRDGWMVLVARLGRVVENAGGLITVRPDEPWFGERRGHTVRLDRTELTRR